MQRKPFVILITFLLLSLSDFSLAQHVVYREVFPSTGVNGKDEALIQGWRGYRNGAPESDNKFQIFGSGNGAATPISSNPQGTLEGFNGFWSPNGVSGVSIFTDEIAALNCEASELVEISWSERNDNNPASNSDTRALVKVNGTWYASELTTPMAAGDDNTVVPNSLDLTTTKWGQLFLDDKPPGDPPAFGPRKTGATVFNLSLPEGEVEYIGIFYDKFYGKLRIDNFQVTAQDPKVPTLSEWGLIILALCLMIIGGLAILHPQINTYTEKISN